MNAERLIELIEESGFNACSYGGRGMYGRQCIGTVVESVKHVLATIIEGCANCEEAADIVRGHSTDSMGSGTIVYWPKVNWPGY